MRERRRRERERINKNAACVRNGCDIVYFVLMIFLSVVLLIENAFTSKIKVRRKKEK